MTARPLVPKATATTEPPAPTPPSEDRRLSAADILAAQDIDSEDVMVPEWGGIVTLRSLTGAQRDRLDTLAWRSASAVTAEARQAAPAAPGRPRTAARPPAPRPFSLRTARVAMSLTNGDGTPMFAESDWPALEQKNGAVIDRLDDIVIRLSRLGNYAVQQATADLKAESSDGSGSD